MNRTDNERIVIESKPSIPAFSVCRRSRDLALATYGTPSDSNPVPFHPELDTVEVLGYGFSRRSGSRLEIGPLISRDASGEGRLEYVSLIHHENPMASGSWWAERVYTRQERSANPPRHWISSPTFERARNVVLCHKTWSPATLPGIVRRARDLLPNVETLTLRAYFREMPEAPKHTPKYDLENRPQDHKLDCLLLGNAIRNIMAWLQRPDFWPPVRTVDFTRQRAPIKARTG